MNSIIDILINSDQAPAEIKNLIEDKIKIKKYPKGTFLQHKGDLNGKGYFVKKGLLRSYLIDKKGKEHIFMFAPENWVIGDIQSQAHNFPTELFIDAIEDTEVLEIDVSLFHNLSNLSVETLRNDITRLIKRIAVLQKRVIMLMSASARERYEEFLKTYPNIVQRVPQKMIASFLGITPEALSKIRGKISKNI